VNNDIREQLTLAQRDTFLSSERFHVVIRTEVVCGQLARFVNRECARDH
jgi:hypothetical protein